MEAYVAYFQTNLTTVITDVSMYNVPFFIDKLILYDKTGLEISS